MKKLLAILILILVSLDAHAQYQCQGSNNTANCPPCYYNTVHIPNYRGNTADGRQKLNVYIRTGNTPGNFDNPPGSGTTATNIWNAVFGCSGCPEGGTQRWNNATDTTSQPGTTNRPPYFFQNGQAGGESGADIIIISDPSQSYAVSDHAHYPVKIFVNPAWAATLTAEELAGIISHEIGHVALGNAYKLGSGCESATTIMQGLNSAGKPLVTTIQDRDVYQMNKYHNNQGNCCANVWDDNAIGPDDGGGGCTGDPCCGDACCGDPCCNDPGCDEECYTICETTCSCEAYDPYDPGDCMWWGYCDTYCYQVCY